MFVMCCIRACESVSNLSRRYVFVEHSLYRENFCHRTTKNSKYGLQMLKPHTHNACMLVK